MCDVAIDRRLLPRFDPGSLVAAPRPGSSSHGPRTLSTTFFSHTHEASNAMDRFHFLVGSSNNAGLPVRDFSCFLNFAATPHTRILLLHRGDQAEESHLVVSKDCRCDVSASACGSLSLKSLSGRRKERKGMGKGWKMVRLSIHVQSRHETSLFVGLQLDHIRGGSNAQKASPQSLWPLDEATREIVPRPIQHGTQSTPTLKRNWAYGSSYLVLSPVCSDWDVRNGPVYRQQRHCKKSLPSSAVKSCRSMEGTDDYLKRAKMRAGRCFDYLFIMTSGALRVKSFYPQNDRTEQFRTVVDTEMMISSACTMASANDASPACHIKRKRGRNDDGACYAKLGELRCLICKLNRVSGVLGILLKAKLDDLPMSLSSWIFEVFQYVDYQGHFKLQSKSNITRRVVLNSTDHEGLVRNYSVDGTNDCVLWYFYAINLPAEFGFESQSENGKF
ncbi:hypothetical protein F5146DRAFT_997844 [Armillaria mellea]|nr:hypothetical protein F5146DRAFT_997844 [Armillaria mellea]